MSHLIIEQGNEVGREVEVPEGGIKFGRSPANDLVLDDAAVMLFHGRIFFKSDGTMWVTDFGAGEKITVGGMPIDEYQLKIGDLVEVGNTAFRIINTAKNHELSVVTDPPLDLSAGQDSIDLGFKRTGRKREPTAVSKSQPRSSLTHRLMQVAVILLVLVVMAFVVPSLMKMTGGGGRKVQARETLALSYERVQADSSNIFRYRLDMDEKGDMTILVDDLKNNRHVQKTKRIPEIALVQLSNSIEDAGFYKLDSDYAGTAEERYDLFDLTVHRNRRYHRIRVLNRVPPAEMKRTVSAIEDFALSELGIPFTLFKDNDELMRLAEHAFELGNTRYAERDVRNSNLAESIKLYKEAKLYLETFEPKPELFANATEGLEQAEKERTRRYEDYMFRAERSMQLKEWEEASRYLQILAELVPDRDDPRYGSISDKLLNVERHLR